MDLFSSDEGEITPLLNSEIEVSLIAEAPRKRSRFTFDADGQ